MGSIQKYESIQVPNEDFSEITFIFKKKAHSTTRFFTGPRYTASITDHPLKHVFATLYLHPFTSFPADAEPWGPHGMNKPQESSQERKTNNPNKRQDFSHERQFDAIYGPRTRLGDYTLGKTLGEGEFGKVKIGWKDSSNAQVAVKIIRREKLDTAGRLAKIHREIAILKQLDHPNIVSLFEMVETSNTIGIILQYASGGELFDYILAERYLKDDKARRLFAQLISGVGYLHRNGIIHRDLKLENLLLDDNKNIIITDFGFANTFDPMGGSNHEYIQNRQLKHDDLLEKNGLGAANENGYKHTDMMATSCGSPCYAAPELVVSDGLYSGRKVDVWSCGVILYAMLAGYLPFDDDPDNPEGDNINLLYKYICNTPLIFPVYVTPHARDLLKRILVPDPMRRADLFEIARHSWLSDYSHLVEGITSDVKMSAAEYERTKALQIPIYEFSHPKGNVDPRTISRATSERFAHKSRQASEDLSNTQQKASALDQRKQERASETSPRDHKRRTVQVEYVPPRSHHHREDSTNLTSNDENRDPNMNLPPVQKRSTSQKRAVNGNTTGSRPTRESSAPAINVPRSRPTDYSAPDQRAARAATEPERLQQRNDEKRRVYREEAAAKQFDPNRIKAPKVAQEHYRPVTMPSVEPPATEPPRPRSERLPPSRGSYGKPSSAEVQMTSAHGQISAPPNKGLPMTPNERTSISPPSLNSDHNQRPTRGHRRSSTLGNLSDKILNRASSISRRSKPTKTDRSHPPTSMRHDFEDTTPSRPSGESPRRSFGFSRKSSDIDSAKPGKRQSRRFSLLPRSKASENNTPVSAQSNGNPQWPAQQMDGATGPVMEASTPQAAAEKLLPGKHKRFNDAYEAKNASSGASRRVMDFFRRRR